jgi:hypothetical protein
VWDEKTCVSDFDSAFVSLKKSDVFIIAAFLPVELCVRILKQFSQIECLPCDRVCYFVGHVYIIFRFDGRVVWWISSRDHVSCVLSCSAPCSVVSTRFGLKICK